MDHDEARRKLLRGSLAAPAVLTVVSPSALAATSFDACIMRQTPPELSEAFKPTDTADNWYRAPVPVYHGTLKEEYAPAGTEREGDYYLSQYDGLYYLIDPAAACTIARPATHFTGNRLEPTETQTWGLVYFTSEGEPVGFGCEPRGGYAITRSCWASFAV